MSAGSHVEKRGRPRSAQANPRPDECPHNPDTHPEHIRGICYACNYRIKHGLSLNKKRGRPRRDEADASQPKPPKAPKAPKAPGTTSTRGRKPKADGTTAKRKRSQQTEDDNEAEYDPQAAPSKPIKKRAKTT
eukprot:TRINITY_DN9528_c0_g1_i1.p1 TRINITY_DN9528_c0_g1~~TRINITY_DN9528_c0_g1_i1.p1  ORF type:complete len:133 (+),score=24.21 TRINITY_DN9528_c0_g1_i1:76-474(+)